MEKDHIEGKDKEIT